MLTIFTIPKPFHGHTEIIQRNAIQSWIRLFPECEIILCGDDHGVKEIAVEFNLQHIPDIEVNEYGTPLLNSAFARSAQRAQNHLLCYVNADIILLSDIVTVVQRVKFERFLMIGTRWTVDLPYLWNFEQADWEGKLREYVTRTGKIDVGAMDYFIFPSKTKLYQLPPFVVGRPGWDNWFVYNARQSNIPVINVSYVVMAVHQRHDYAHVQNPTGFKWMGPEADYNSRLMKGMKYDYGLLDATHFMTSRRLLPKILMPSVTLKYLRRKLFIWIASPQTEQLRKLYKKFKRFLKIRE